MKYWLFTTEYPPAHGGGISTYCYHTARMLLQQGYAVTVFVNDDNVATVSENMEEGIRVVRFNTEQYGQGGQLGNIAKVSYAFAGVAMSFIRREGKPGFIEAQDYLAIGYYILQFRHCRYDEFADLPVIITIHSPAFLYLMYNREGIYSFPNYWTGEMEKSCLRAADWLIAPSRYIVSEIRQHLQFDESRLSVIPNPYENGEIVRNDRITKNKIVFFGKLSPQKGVFEMFTYLKDMWDNGFTEPIHIVGGTEKVYYPEMKTMGSLIKEKYKPYLQKGLIRFVGVVSPDERNNVLADAHLILVPSINDNLPYVVIESMGMGKMVLASRQGGQTEIIENGQNGLLFDHSIPGDFAAQVKWALALPEETVREIGDAAINTISERFNYNHINAIKSPLLKRIKEKEGSNDLFPYIIDGSKPVQFNANNEKKGLLSVVIPYFNMGAYISECITSILGCVYRPMEIIIVNDGSNDAPSLDKLNEIAVHSEIKLVHKKNEGLALARNYGALVASGEFLAFLDADDKVHREYYSRAINILNGYRNVFFVGCWVQYFGDKNEIWPTWNPELPYILLHNSLNSSSLVYRRGAFLAGGQNDPALEYGLEDYDSVIGMIEKGLPGVVLPESLFYYRIRQGSMFRSMTKYKTLYSYQLIASKHAALYNLFGTQIYNLLNANGPAFNFDNPTFSLTVSSQTGKKNLLLRKVEAVVKKNKILKKIVLKIINK